VKVTVPVGIAAPFVVSVMVAVKVTLWPKTLGLTEETTAVAVESAAMAAVGAKATIPAANKAPATTGQHPRVST
jgi:hypothetical protein